MKISYQWLQTYFEQELPSIETLDKVIAVQAFETESLDKLETGDAVLDVDVLPNRAHDCLSHQGIAKEISALFEIPMKKFDARYSVKEFPKSEKKVVVNVESDTKTKRAMMTVIENVQVGESPQWLKDRLTAIGQRSINNIVDITNYVMFDTGKPVHAFDYDKLAGGDNKKISIQFAQSGEKISTLNDEVYDLDETIVVIHDGEKPMDIAGIKGGADTGVDENTKNVLLTSCTFDPLVVRQMVRKLKLQSDASKRFENEQTPEYAELGMSAMIRMIANPELAGTNETKVGDIVDQYVIKAETPQVEVDLDRINEILGTELTEKEVSVIFDRLGFSYTISNMRYTITVPAERLDLRISEDIIEEVGRIYGYENIKSADIGDLNFKPKVHKTVYYQNKVRDLLKKQGFSEVMTYSFQKKGDVEVANPVAKDKPALRNNLFKGFKEALEKNAQNAELFGADIVKIFEFGKVFEKNQGQESEVGLMCKESLHLALGVMNKGKQAKKKYGDEQSHIEEIVKKIQDVGIRIQGVSKLSAQNSGHVLEIDFDSIIEDLPEPETYEHLAIELSQKKFQPFSPYPFITRDIALWVDDGVPAHEPQELIIENAGELLVRVDLFDSFEKDGKISYAYRLIFQSMEKTLSDQEVNEVMEKIESVAREKGWEVR